jgi:hypothetical protein
MALVIVSFVAGATLLQVVAGIACGLALIALCVPRGPILHSYGKWSARIL